MRGHKSIGVALLFCLCACGDDASSSDGGGDGAAGRDGGDPTRDAGADDGGEPLADAAALDGPFVPMDAGPARLDPVPFAYVLVDGSGPSTLWQKAVGDLTGDGQVDLIAGGHSSGGLVYYENPTWTRHAIPSSSNSSTDGEVADVDRDGDLDIVSLTSSQIRWYENPSWAVHTIGAASHHDVEVADLDGDGDVDAVARNQSAFGGDGNSIHFYLQEPSSWSHRSIPCAHGEGLVVSDLDADGDSDVVINGSWFENTGGGMADAWPEHTYATEYAHLDTFVALGDLNRDGRVDIVLSPAELAGTRYRISWFEAPADRTLTWPEHIIDADVETVHHFVGTADLNNDGHVDVATAEMSQGADPDEVRIYLNAGGGLDFSPHVVATTGSHSMRLVDVDDDGDVDMYGANHQADDVELWINMTVVP